MPKQILVANKSRKQTVKVNFRQTKTLGGGAPTVAPPAKKPNCVMGLLGPPNKQSFHRSVKCMTFPGNFLELLIALL